MMIKTDKLKQIFMLCTALLLCVKLNAANPADSLKNTEQPTLANALNPNGTLKPGVSGSFNAQGYKISKGKDGQPVFSSTTLAAGDENWDNSISDGTTITTNAMTTIGTDIYIGTTDNIYKWSGTDWEIVGGGVNGAVYCMTVKGTDLYVGGAFTTAGGVTVNRIAKWDGTAWSGLGPNTTEVGVINNTVRAIAVLDTDIYVGGDFSGVNSGVANSFNIAKWNSVTLAWSALGVGVNGPVYAIAVSGATVYVGGSFTGAGGASRSRIAEWWSGHGTWQNAGNAAYIGSGTVYTIGVLGTTVYVGGDFAINGSSNTNIAWLSNNTWGSALTDGAVHNIVISGGVMYVSGAFTRLATVTNATRRMVRFFNNGWLSMGSGANDIIKAATILGTDLYIGGEFNSKQMRKFTVSNGSWSIIDSEKRFDNAVRTVAVLGTDIYVGGDFTNPANGIAKWNGTNWSSLGDSPNFQVYALAVHNGKLYVGGTFTAIGALTASRIAVYNPATSTWSKLGDYGVNNTVTSLAVHDNTLYVGGTFTKVDIDNKDANYVAKWDITNQTWGTLGTGADAGVKHSSIYAPVGVYSVAVSAAGDVYVGGYFNSAGGSTVAASNIAKWNIASSTWSALGSGIWAVNYVYAIAVSGTDVYVGGDFTNPSNRIAKWNGTTWSGLGPDAINVGTNLTVRSIAVLGTDVYVGGDFTNRGNRIAKFNGTTSTWSTLGSGTNGIVRAITISGNKVYVGGDFTTAGDKQANYVATYNATNPLPVTLTSFTAKAQNNSAVLNWQTASESNNSHFVVKHSTDGVNFSEINTVNAKSANGAAYSYTDYKPVNGTNYYQLLQVDLDGKTTDLGVRTASFGLPVSDIRFYPNPVTDRLNVKLNGKPGNVRIINLTGTVVLQQEIAAGTEEVSIGVSNLTSGVYVIAVDNGGTVSSVKFVKE